MSSEKVQEFLQKKEQEKVKQEAQFRYKILSLYDLGEKVYYKEGEPYRRLSSIKRHWSKE